MRKANSVLLGVSLGILVAGCGGSSGSSGNGDTVVSYSALPNEFGKSFVSRVSGNGLVALGLQTDSRDPIYWNGTAGPLSISPSGGLSAESITGVSTNGETFVGELGGSSTTSAYRYTVADGFTEVPSPAGVTDRVVAIDISGDGSVVVGETRPLSGKNRAFVSSEGVSQLLPEYAPDTTSVPMRISANGKFVVGRSNGQAVRWNLTTGTVAPLRSDNSIADACSSDGSVVVGRFGFGSPSTVFLWTAEFGVESLGFSVIPDNALAISGDGKKIVGNRADGTPFVWTRDLGLRNLATELNWKNTAFPGLINVYTSSISLDGKTIVGGAQSSESSGVSIGWRLKTN